jgi:hypothetical protein
LPVAASAAPLTTDTATGTSCSRSDRFCAVTMMSAPMSSAAAIGVAAGAAV